ncbi:hypothetical protein JTE90_021235 [Oedothorax gibbosus]|uniref:Uncharacterized protein n=1 Tax=Oedothorax gibbosus TaxID=931172 RepID=A0AAV6UX47_9ARAC|nr:hypothetical protein JTE90_021235 [Oedothorax gibbosus]
MIQFRLTWKDREYGVRRSDKRLKDQPSPDVLKNVFFSVSQKFGPTLVKWFKMTRIESTQNFAELEPNATV